MFLTISCMSFQPTGGMKAYWRVTYVDEDFRMLYTNNQNLFILVRA